MAPIEKKRLKVELLQVQAGKAAQDFRIEQLLEEIDRIKVSIAASEEKEQELIKKIEG